jgi:hypothetical protein
VHLQASPHGRVKRGCCKWAEILSMSVSAGVILTHFGLNPSKWTGKVR